MFTLLSKLSSKVLYGLGIFLILTAFATGILISNTYAQVPSEYVPCGERADEEYHSLRPYQASPCDQGISETALFCGNQLIIQDTVSGSSGSCIDTGDGMLDCTVERTREIAINLSDAELPILGNTEDVVNSQQQNSDLDPAEKTTQYVSWYLNGALNKAETAPIGEEDIQTMVDFSGPINKLYPKEVQNQQRVETVRKAGDDRHDQVVGCTYLFGVPGPCYEGGLLSFTRNKHYASEWQGHLPPSESDYEDFQDYWRDYQEWRGKRCFQPEIPSSVPVIGGKSFLLCGEDPTRPNYYANLFPNIPYSSTEDRIGQVSIEPGGLGLQAVDSDVEISNVTLTGQTSAELYFAHTEESAELAEILQKTYLPQGESGTGSTTGVSPQGRCDLANIRTNPGDNLFPGEIGATLQYTASFQCEADSGTCYQECLSAGNSPVECRGLPVCGGGSSPSGSCTKTVNISLSLLTETPKADEVWQRTVAGPAGIFKRIAPKVGIGGPILGLLDIPAATKVNYSSPNSTVFAGNPGNERSGESAELYFPHIGGVQEYFLKGIQTFLRPKGFGEDIATGELAEDGDVNCDMDAPEVKLSNLIGREEYHQLALDWVSGQPGSKALECYNAVVSETQNAGVNSALALWIWLNESGASNYNVKSNVLDFGSEGAPPENFTAQLESFISTAQAYGNASSNSQCSGRPVSNLEAFAYLYATGTCDPSTPIKGTNQTAGDYYEAMSSGIGLVSSCSVPNGSTDTSCP